MGRKNSDQDYSIKQHRLSGELEDFGRGEAPDGGFSGIVSLITICSTVVLPAGIEREESVTIWPRKRPL